MAHQLLLLFRWKGSGHPMEAQAWVSTGPPFSLGHVAVMASPAGCFQSWLLQGRVSEHWLGLRAGQGCLSRGWGLSPQGWSPLP